MHIKIHLFDNAINIFTTERKVYICNYTFLNRIRLNPNYFGALRIEIQIDLNVRFSFLSLAHMTTGESHKMHGSPNQNSR